MRFSVATNFQENFIQKINKKEVSEIYGKLTSDFTGGGRMSYMLPSISKKKLRQHIKEAHENELEFNYLLNTICLTGREFTSQGQKKIRKLLDYLENIGTDSITVALPFLLKLIKKKYPSFKVNISLFANIDNLNKAKYWENMGADMITLMQSTFNRDFNMLEKIREHIKCELQLIANNGCLLSCPFGFWHTHLLCHGSQQWNKYRKYIVDYCGMACKYIRLKDPSNFIRAVWIRPEDINYYEKIGIDSLKIVDRVTFTDTILSSVNAYTKRSYAGNLSDLIPMYSKNSVHKTKNSSNISTGREVYIDNRKLDGFLEFFIRGNCKKICNECKYCHEIAKKVVKIDQGYRENTLNQYKKLGMDNNILFPI